ncbi:MAG: branched-chain amino acid ABC transporter permease [SAR324 cluster bacterium]
MDLQSILQLVINGVLGGAVYALAALGLALIFGVSGVLNLAHGEFLMLGGFFTYLGYDRLGINPFILVFLVPPVFFVLGYVFERVMIRPLALRKEHVRLASATLVTLGAALIFEDVAAYASLGTEFDKSIGFFIASLTVGTLVLPSLKLIVFGLVVLLMAELAWFLKYTYVGLAVQAVTQSPRGARLSGVNVATINGIAFGLGTFLAAAAGALEVIHSSVNPLVGLPLTLKYLCIIVMGGLGSLAGVTLGGMVIGLSESIVGYFTPAWGQTVAYLLLVGILLIRPRGLLGR